MLSVNLTLNAILHLVDAINITKNITIGDAFEVILAGVRGIEPRSWVLETHILAVVLYPFATVKSTYIV